MVISALGTCRRSGLVRASLRPLLSSGRSPPRDREVPTPFGTTYVVTSGIPGGKRFVLVHAAALSATQWYPQAADLGMYHRLYAVDIMGDIGLSTQTRLISHATRGGRMAGRGPGRPRPRAAGLHRLVVRRLPGDEPRGLHHPDRWWGSCCWRRPRHFVLFKRVANLMIRAGTSSRCLHRPPGLRGMMGGGLPDERIVHRWRSGSPVSGMTEPVSTRSRSPITSSRPSPARPSSSSGSRSG